MGEVSMDVLPEVNENATNPYSVQFWREWGSEEYSGHALFAVFCFTVPILILNILTAFAIKVSVAQLDIAGGLPVILNLVLNFWWNEGWFGLGR